VTRDTGTTYAGAASAKLVAGGTDANYLQSVNVGDTVSYNLIAYAYKGVGQAVTTNDINLYYDTGVLSTSFAQVGATDWYKLTGTITGVASVKNYGVRVKAGKTIYVDSMSLQAGSGAATTLYIANSGTGVANVDMESAATIHNGLTAGGTLTFSNLTSCANGLITDINGVVSCSASDVNMKKNITPINDALAKILGLTGVRYQWIDPALGAGYEYGLIAQDVAKVAPELVFAMGNGTMGVKYDKAVGLIIEAMKQQQAQIASMSARIAPHLSAGFVTVPASTTSQRVLFDRPFANMPVVTMSLTVPRSTDSAFLAESTHAAISDPDKYGFTILLAEPVPQDVRFNWTAMDLAGESGSVASVAGVASESAILK
jgi:hypothetical protein